MIFVLAFEKLLISDTVLKTKSIGAFIVRFEKNRVIFLPELYLLLFGRLKRLICK